MSKWYLSEEFAATSPEREGFPSPGPERSLVEVCGREIWTVRGRTKTRTSVFSFGRYAHSEGLLASYRTDVDDAFIAVYEFLDRPSHILSIDGVERPVEAARQGSVKICDLNHVYEGEHSYRQDGFYIHMPRLAIRDLFSEYGSEVPENISTPHGSAVHDDIMTSLSPIVREITRGKTDTHMLFQSHMLISLVAYLGTTYGRLQRLDMRRGGLAPWQLRRAKELIAARHGLVDLVELAEECQLSPGYFAKAFKTTTGLTPHRWLSNYRIERAMDLLKRPERSLEDIAKACGYADQAHFTRAFRRAVGETPGAWRRAVLR